MSNDLQTINKQIAETLSGNGSFDDLKRLQAEKAEIEQRAYFDRISKLKAEIADLEQGREIAFELQKDFDAELQSAAKIVIEKRGELMDAEQQYNVIKSRQYALENEINSKREAIRELKLKLDILIKSKIAEVTA